MVRGKSCIEGYEWLGKEGIYSMVLQTGIPALVNHPLPPLVAAIVNYLKFDIHDLQLTHLKSDMELRSVAALLATTYGSTDG